MLGILKKQIINALFVPVHVLVENAWFEKEVYFVEKKIKFTGFYILYQLCVAYGAFLSVAHELINTIKRPRNI